MNRTILLVLTVLMAAYTGFAQPLTGYKTIPGNYSSVHNAIFALNSQGVGPGGVTFTIAGGYTESWSTLTSGLITATGTAANPIVFRWSGSGARPVISGYVSAPGAADYVFCLQGTDYITFDGIDVVDQTATIEWGYAILKGSVSDGSQFVTIKNCSVTLDKSNTATAGIYSNNVTPLDPTHQLNISNKSATNSNMKFFSNTITNCYNGIIISGFNDPDSTCALYDQKNEIGKDGANFISDFGGAVPACSGIYTIYQNDQKIAKNMISGPATGSGECSGIYLGTAWNASLEVDSNNVSIYYGGTGRFNGIAIVTGHVYSDPMVMNIYNNVVENCIYESPVSATCIYLRLDGGSASCNFHHNIIANNAYGNGGTVATGSLYGISFHYSNGVPGTSSFHHNQVTGISRNQSVTGSGSTYYMRLSGANTGTGQSDIYSNLVDNNIVVSKGECIGLYCLIHPEGQKNIYDNVVTNILDANGNIDGINTGNSRGTKVYRNKVQNLNASGATSVVTGINLNNVMSGNMYGYNNFVGDLKNTASSNNLAVIGIKALTSTNANFLFIGIYNNTVFLNAVSTGAHFGTAGLYLGTTPKLNEVMNNIIVNTSTPSGSGVTAALRYESNRIFNYAKTSGNNDFYAGTPGPANLIYYDQYVADQTLAAFRARVSPSDANSITELPPFMNVASSPVDLHINQTVPTGIESSGHVVTNLVVNTDFDPDPRYPSPGYPVNVLYPPIAPDMGADEFGGIPNDLTPPVMAYTPLLNTASLAERTLTATITDLHGVPTTGAGLPRIAWKKFSNGAWSYVTGIYTGNNQYSFSFGGNVSLYDSIYYYILAQDNWSTPNAGSWPMVGASGFTANPPAAIIPPVPPFSYKIVQGLCGTLQVGAGQTYATLTAAIDDISTKALSCPVTLLLTDNDYNGETYPIVIGQIAGASETNTLTIKPAPGKTPLFQTSYLGDLSNPRAMISLNGSQYVNFDGSNSGGNDRSMTFWNTGGADGFRAAMGLFNNGTTAASYITIKNCILQAKTETQTNSQSIVFFKISGYAGYHDIVLDNNAINSAKLGVQVTGIAANPVRDCKVINNTIGSTDYSKNINTWGIDLQYCDNTLIEGNEIIGSVEGRATEVIYTGIILREGTTNTRIRKNMIHDWVQNELGSNGAAGITYAGYGEGLTEISNNLIYSIKAPGQNQDLNSANAYGIYLASGGNLQIHYNTVYLGGNYLSSTGEVMSACLGTWHRIANVDVKNNIFKNSSQPVSGSPLHKSFAVTIGNSPVNITLDHNDYFVNGIGPNTGYFNGIDQTTLSAWKAATGQDEHTVSTDPLFISETNLKPTTVLMSHTGTYLAALPTDFPGINRTNPPDAGAYEFSENPEVVTGTAMAITATSVTLGGTINAVYFTVASFFDFGLNTSYLNSVGGAPSTVVGNSATPVSVTLTGLMPATTYHFRARGVASDGLIIYGNDQTFTMGAGIPENTNATGSVSNDTCINAIHVITVGGTTDPFVVTATGHATLVAGEKIICLPGTMVMQGGYFHGYITTDGQYCMAPGNPVVSNQKEGDVQSIVIEGNRNQHFKIYPNPVGNSFTLEWTGDGESGMLSAEVFTMSGIKVLSEDLFSEHSHVFSVEGLRPGVYIIRVKTGKSRETLKLIKL